MYVRVYVLQSHLERKRDKAIRHYRKLELGAVQCSYRTKESERAMIESSCVRKKERKSERGWNK